MAKFDWLKSAGATDQAVAVLNDQPELFTNLIIVFVGLGIQGLVLWYIHFATMKPEQKKKKASAKKGILGSLWPSKKNGDNVVSAAGKR